MYANPSFYYQTLSMTPTAYAIIQGSTTYPDIKGIANFYELANHDGLLVEVILLNLPTDMAHAPSFLGLHIHEKGDCSMNFENTGGHFNPNQTSHPYHTGDLPSILNSDSDGYLVFYDSFLSVDAINGRSIILHDQRDDFTTQPSGDSGNKIACGVIIQPFSK